MLPSQAQLNRSFAFSFGERAAIVMTLLESANRWQDAEMRSSASICETL